MFGFFWSIATAPIDMQYLSNIGLKDAPPFVVFQMPPPAVPTYIVLPSPFTPSMAVMRPLIVPGPSQRASIFPNVEELTLVCEKTSETEKIINKTKAIFLMTVYLAII